MKSCYKYLTKFISPYIIDLMRFIVKNDFIRAKHATKINNEIKTHIMPWHFLFLLMKKRQTIEIKIVLSKLEVYTVILCKYQFY